MARGSHILLGVLVLGGALLAFEYSRESSALDAYQRAAAIESENRSEILQQYAVRESALEEMASLSHRIDGVHGDLVSTDCYTAASTCRDADYWNRGSSELQMLFDSYDRLSRQASGAVNLIQDVAAPSDLWLLSMLGQDNSATIQGRLDDFLVEIDSLKESINFSAKRVNDWNADCVSDRIISCSVTGTLMEYEQ